MAPEADGASGHGVARVAPHLRGLEGAGGGKAPLYGTRVSGIIGAKGGETGPDSGMAGICWEVGLIPVVVSAPN